MIVQAVQLYDGFVNKWNKKGEISDSLVPGCHMMA